MMKLNTSHKRVELDGYLIKMNVHGKASGVIQLVSPIKSMVLNYVSLKELLLLSLLVSLA